MPATATKATRAKVSTTVAAENYRFLEERVASGEARSIAEAVDQSIAALRQLENRIRLAKATAKYFNSLHSHAAAEERVMAKGLSSAAKDIDFDKEP